MPAKPSSVLPRDPRLLGPACSRPADRLSPIVCALLDVRDEAIMILGPQREPLYVNAAARALLPPGTIALLSDAQPVREQLMAGGGRVVPLRGDGKVMGEMIVMRSQRVRTLVERERDAIHETLGQTGGRRAAAARHLGISRTTLWRRLRAERQ